MGCVWCCVDSGCGVVDSVFGRFACVIALLVVFWGIVVFSGFGFLVLRFCVV